MDLRPLTRDLVLFTFVIETLGRCALRPVGASLRAAGAAWPALFHSVSAFCNAGFSTFSDSVDELSARPGERSWC